MVRAVLMTRTAKVMIASVEGASEEKLGVVLLQPGYGHLYPSASAAFASVHSLHSSGGVVCATEASRCKISKV